MWAQLAASWNLLGEFNKPLNDLTYRLAVDHYNYFENKHNIISDNLNNNYHWHKENIFDNLTGKEWERKYLSKD
jgi:hypothetical protein